MTHPIQYIWLAIYLFALLALFFYGINCYVLMFFYWRRRGQASKRYGAVKAAYLRRTAPEDWPRVSVQLPIYNERYVVQRLIEAVCRLDYPKSLLEIQILDDSTDDTVQIAQAVAARMKQQGFDIVYLHRQDRSGFKAGALKAGLGRAKGELLAIFDADFMPDADFLMETVPYFADPLIGMLQTRWGHINGDYSLLTRAQSMGIDGHFGIEQGARAWNGLFMNFNGTAGVWRKSAIIDAGGWQADTLTEDLDLSYRAQLNGWKLQFIPDVVCPAEVPVTINAFKSQQHRWAKGSIQTAKKNLGRIFKARLPLVTKVQAFLHLTHYMVHPMMLLVVLTSIPMLLYTRLLLHNWAWPLVVFTLFCLATCGPSSMYVFSQKIIYKDWKKRLKYIPLLMCLGTGIAVNNTKAVLEALLNLQSGFIRTPKYGVRVRCDAWRGKCYAIPLSLLSIIEFLFGLYSLAGLGLFLFFSKYLVSPFLVIYASGFFYVFFLSVKQGYGKRQA
ncbi:MAG: glycosyltransferase [Desulfosarcinaceae bacterium]|jgi:cellulose synthase/poly-beta-1,6-N-acetylglucosamine synthase-like glycosyltransferase